MTKKTAKKPKKLPRGLKLQPCPGCGTNVVVCSNPLFGGYCSTACVPVKKGGKR